MGSWLLPLTQPHARFDGRPPSRPLESALPTMIAGKAAASETEQAEVEVTRGDLLKLSLSLDLHEAGGLFIATRVSRSILPAVPESPGLLFRR